MSRKLSVFTETWEDPRFKKALEKFTPEEQDSIRDTIKSFLNALRECRHPALDPDLQQYHPTAYRVRNIKGLIEYRFRPWILRIVVQCLDVAKDGEIVLVGRTLEHDHERLKKLIEKKL